MTIERIEPGPGQESVWDYPRPARVEDCSYRIQVNALAIPIADSRSAKRLLEMSHPPVFYIPQQDVRMDLLEMNAKRTFCESKGDACYFDLHVDSEIRKNVARSYPSPTKPFLSIRDYIAFYPHRMEACFVNGELVQPQKCDYYGGWITSNIVGPFKGEK